MEEMKNVIIIRDKDTRFEDVLGTLQTNATAEEVDKVFKETMNKYPEEWSLEDLLEALSDANIDFSWDEEPKQIYI